MSTYSSILLSALACAAGVKAHITMHDPAPFSPKPDNSPISSSNYPCKVGSGLSASTVSRATVGQSLQLSFDGSATHGGGSCQVSLSRDGASKLSAKSQFKVIYSIMGGCPGSDGANNKYQVNIPKEVPSGDYTLAWTWFNKVGNREMYMNCAPVSISGGRGSDHDFNSLPDMAVFNIAAKNDCKTTETRDVQFPNPGKYVEMSPNAKLAPPTGSCATGTSSGGSGSFPVVSPSGGSSSSGSSGSYNNGYHPSGSGSSGYNDGMYHPSGTSSSGSNSGQYTPSSQQSGGYKSRPTSAPAPASPPASSNSGNHKTGGSGQACSAEGAVVCSADGTQFGLCNFGKANLMAVAPGTRCSNGVIARRNIWEKY